MKNVEHLASVTLAGLAGVYNAAVANHSLPVDPVKKFASKDAATARIGKLADEYGLDLIVINDGEVALVQNGTPPSADEVEETEGAGDDEGTEDEALDPTEDAEEEPAPAEDAPFVKATKEELAAMDGPTRASYRKARRAAARKARKARQA